MCALGKKNKKQIMSVFVFEIKTWGERWKLSPELRPVGGAALRKVLILIFSSEPLAIELRRGQPSSSQFSLLDVVKHS